VDLSDLRDRRVDFGDSGGWVGDDSGGRVGDDSRGWIGGDSGDSDVSSNSKTLLFSIFFYHFFFSISFDSLSNILIL
jgi:hypothetical protein